MEDNREYKIRVKRFKWLPRFVNNYREGKVVKSYFKAYLGNEYVNAWYRILPGRSLAAHRPRSLFIWNGDGGEVVYKRTACTDKNGIEQMTFSKMEK